MADKERKYVPVFLDWLETTQDLSAEEKGNLIDAVVAYASGKEYEHLLTGGCRIAFRFLKGQIDRSRDISEKRSNAGSKTKQTGTNESKQEQTETKTLNNNNNKDNNNNKEENKRKKFSPPAIEDVAAYCKEIGFDIDPQYFLDYQTARNWVLSNGKQAKDWKAVLRTWAHNNFSKPKAKSVPAQEYTQRSYVSEDQEAMERMLAEYGNTG